MFSYNIVLINKGHIPQTSRGLFLVRKFQHRTRSQPDASVTTGIRRNLPEILGPTAVNRYRPPITLQYRYVPLFTEHK